MNGTGTVKSRKGEGHSRHLIQTVIMIVAFEILLPLFQLSLFIFSSFLGLKVFLSSQSLQFFETQNPNLYRSSPCSSMAESSPYGESHFPYPDLNPALLQPNPMRPRPRGKSCTHFLFKALLVAVVIIVLPLFPSQAPEFINESIITKFWELLHLLFIGIAVSYGLFCRRNVEMGIETQSKIENLQYDMSRMFHVSSFYEDGYENLHGSDEKRVIQSCNDQFHLLGESEPLFSTGNTVIGEQCNPNLHVGENDFENSCDYGDENTIQAWNSQYFQGESMLVLAQPNYGLGEWGEARSTVDYKPLGLPIRSLNSRVRKRENPELVNGYDSPSGSQGSSSENSVKGQNENFDELGPQNVEDKFNEAVASPSPIPWNSRSGRTERRENLSSVSRPSHFRPLLVEETQFESLRTPSLRSTASFSSHANPMCSSLGNASPSHSVNSEGMSSKMKDEGIKTESSKTQNTVFAADHSHVSRPSHFRPFSVDETQFESLRKLRTPSLRSCASFSSHASSMSSSPGNGSPSHSVSSEVISSKMEDEGSKTPSFQGSYASSGLPSPTKPTKRDVRKAKSSSGSGLPSPPKSINDKASEVMNSEVEEEGSKTNGFQGSPVSSGLPSPPKPTKPDVTKTKSYQGSSASGSPSPPKQMNDKASFSGFHTRGYSCSSLYENDSKGPKNYLTELSESRREDLLSSKESKPSSVTSEMKALSPAKPSLRGKSVRTIRSRRLTSKAYDNGAKTEEMYGDVETAYVRKETVRKEGIDSLVIGSSKPDLDIHCAIAKHTVPEYQKTVMEEFSENVSAGPEEGAENEAEKFRLSSGEDADSKSVNDATADSNEVDKKAGEFIAKFREQIRLQKVASMERSRGLRLGGNFR